MKKTACLALLVFLVSLALRLFFIWETHLVPEFASYTPGLDVDIYWNAARLLRLHPAGYPVFELVLPSAPFFVYFLSLTQRVLGESLLAHRILMAVIGSLTQVVMFHLCYRLTKVMWAALLTSLAAMLLPSLVYFDTVVLKASVELLMLSILLFVLADDRTWKSLVARWQIAALIIALLLSALFLSQQNTFLYIFGVLACISVDRATDRRTCHKIIATIIVIYVLCCAGIGSLVNVGNVGPQRFAPQSGIALNMGFHPESPGYYQALPGVPGTPLGQVFFGRMNAELEANRELSFSEANSFYIAKTFRNLLDKPVPSLKPALRRALLFFNDFEIKDIHYLDFIRRYSWLLSISPVGFGTFVVLAALGILRLCVTKRWRLLTLLTCIVAAVLASNILTLVSWRVRIQAVLPLWILSTFGLIHVGDMITMLRKRQNHSTRGISRILWIMPVTAAACLLAYAPVIRDDEKELFLRRSEHAARTAATLVHHNKLMKDLSVLDRNDEAIRIARSRILVQSCRHTEAFAELTALVRQGSEEVWANRKYLEYVLWLGDYGTAHDFLEHYRSSFPDLFPAVARQHHPILQGILDTFVLMPSQEKPGQTDETRDSGTAICDVLRGNDMCTK